MVIALEDDVNFTAELVVATADYDVSAANPHLDMPLYREYDLPRRAREQKSSRSVNNAVSKAFISAKDVRTSVTTCSNDCSQEISRFMNSQIVASALTKSPCRFCPVISIMLCFLDQSCVKLATPFEIRKLDL